MRSRLAVLLLVIASTTLSCGTSTEPYVHEPTYEKNISTLYGFQQDADEDIAPNFEWRDSNGVTRTLNDLLGKVVVVNFWATWCAPCLVEMPSLNDIAKDMAADSVVVIGISTDQSGNVLEKVRNFHRSKRLIFQVIMDPNMDAYKTYSPTNETLLPQTYIIDRDGYIYTRFYGEQQYDTFRESIEELL